MKPRRLKTVTTINGRRVAPESAKISVFDNSLLYAEGLFETLLAMGDRVIFSDEHLDRLYRGAEVIDLKIPVDRDTLKEWMHKTVRLHDSPVKKLRLTITSGEAARWTGVQGKPQVILSSSPHQLPERPFRLHVSRFRVDQASVFRRIKTISYAIHAAALQQAKAKHADDALMLNEKNRVAEVTSANIYWVKDGRIYTPPISAGCLEGITRKVVITEAKKLGWDVRQKQETLEGIRNADEVFISSSLKLVIGVAAIINDTEHIRFRQGPITHTLRSHFRSMVGL